MLEEEKYFKIKEVSLIFLPVNLLSEKLTRPWSMKELPQRFPPNAVSLTFFGSLGMDKSSRLRPLEGPRLGGSVCKALATEGTVTPAGPGHAGQKDGHS